MANNNRKCIVCGQNYRYCSNCAEFSGLEIWHNIFHNANCKEIYDATSMFKKTSVEETKARLDQCDLSNKENFHTAILDVINKVYVTDNKKIIEEIAEEVMDGVTDIVTESTIEETTEIIEKTVAYNNSRKKKR